MEIALFDIKEKSMEEYFKKKLKKHKLKFFSNSIHEVPTREYKNSSVIIVFIYSKVSENIIDKLAKLKLILTQSTGYDHIDLKYCMEKGIKVGYVPFYGENTVAEHTFALILNLSRKIHKSYLRTIQSNFSIDGLRGFDLKDKTLGVIGVGHIGLHVIRIAKGFGMHVKACDTAKDMFTSEILHYKYAELEEVLKTSDIISLHLPLNKHTHHFLDEDKIKLTKKGVIIINTSRGALIDTNILYKYIKSGHIAGVGLDVIEGEEFIAHEDELIGNPQINDNMKILLLDKKLFELDNVIFTPHNAFNSKEAIHRILETTIENFESFLKSNEVKYSVIKHS